MPRLTTCFPALIASCAAAACSGAIDPADATTERANILVITLDTTRADALGCYGGPAWATPHLDRLAREGVRFEQARSVSPVTMPSHCSVFTGLFPYEHGVRDNATFVLPEETRTLAERLGEAGYSTAAVLGSVVLHSNFGLDQGFDVYSNVPRTSIETSNVEDQRRADEVVDEALRQLRGKELAEPFLLWLHVFDPHWPYEPPEELLAEVAAHMPGVDRTDDRLRYAAEVRFVDRELGRLFERMPARMRNDLLTVVVADHGEGLGDHGESSHGLQLYDTTIRVPMLMHHPQLAAGLVVDAPVSIADVTPTLLALVGQPDAGLSGSDLSQVVLGAAQAADRFVYAEACTPYYTRGWAPLFMHLQGSLKLIEGPVPEIFDLGDDALEHVDLAGGQEEFSSAARAAFAELRGATRPSERIELSPDQQRELMGLGYVAPSGAGEEELTWWPGRIVAGLRDPKAGLPGQRMISEAFWHLEQKNVQEAVRLVRKVLEDDPENPLFLASAGTMFMAAELYSEAADVLSKSLERREHAGARCALANSLVRLERVDEALELLQQNTALHPEHLQSRLALAELLVQRGRFEECARHLEYFLEKHEGEDRYSQHAGVLLNRVRQRL